MVIYAETPIVKFSTKISNFRCWNGAKNAVLIVHKDFFPIKSVPENSTGRSAPFLTIAFTVSGNEFAHNRGTLERWFYENA